MGYFFLFIFEVTNNNSMKKLHVLLSIISIILPLVTIGLLIKYPSDKNSLIFLSVFLVTALWQVWVLRKHKINLTKRIK